MYLHIGSDVSVSDRDIVGIFDIDKTTVTGETRNFLSRSEQKGTTVSISDEMPRSFILVEEGRKRKEHKVYISPISSSTLNERLKRNIRD